MSLRDYLASRDFRFNKQFGQNFISDGNLLAAIVADAGVTSEDTVLEIGAGAGTLTAALAEKARNVVAYEIDKNLVPILKETLSGLDNVEVIFQDFMKATTEELRERFAGARVVANLPYYVTTPILLRLLEEGIGDHITVMVQKEVADRLCAEPGGKDYGAITVKMNLLGNTTMTRVVGRQMFYPAPNVDSAVVRFDRQENKFADPNPALTSRVVRTAFAMRRKTLTNNLMQGLGVSRAVAEAAIAKTGHPLTVRGEILSAKDYVALSAALVEAGYQLE